MWLEVNSSLAKLYRVSLAYGHPLFGAFSYPSAFLVVNMFRHPAKLGCSQLSLAASGLATFQELVMVDPALPVGVEESAWMMLMRITEASVLLFATGLRLRRFYKHLALHF